MSRNTSGACNGHAISSTTGLFHHSRINQKKGAAAIAAQNCPSRHVCRSTYSAAYASQTKRRRSKYKPATTIITGKAGSGVSGLRLRLQPPPPPDDAGDTTVISTVTLALLVSLSLA